LWLLFCAFLKATGRLIGSGYDFVGRHPFVVAGAGIYFVVMLTLMDSANAILTAISGAMFLGVFIAFFVALYIWTSRAGKRAASADPQ
jgi:hypothetical protein